MYKHNKFFKCSTDLLNWFCKCSRTDFNKFMNECHPTLTDSLKVTHLVFMSSYVFYGQKDTTVFFSNLDIQEDPNFPLWIQIFPCEWEVSTF